MALVTRLGALTTVVIAVWMSVASGASAEPFLPEPTSITLTPNSAIPGQQIDIRVFCPQDAALATSPVTTPATLSPAADGGLFADTTVKPHAVAGTYTMTIRCDAHVFHVPFIVRDASADPGENTLTVIVAALMLALSFAMLAFWGLQRFVTTPRVTRLPDGGWVWRARGGA